MRHGKKVNHLSRQTGHRKAMLANMACSLIEHKRINTTVAKAKALKQFVEPLVTKSKEDTTHNRRIVFAYLRSKYAVTDLFRDVAAKVVGLSQGSSGIGGPHEQSLVWRILSQRARGGDERQRGNGAENFPARR